MAVKGTQNKEKLCFIWDMFEELQGQSETRDSLTARKWRHVDKQVYSYMYRYSESL